MLKHVACNKARDEFSSTVKKANNVEMQLRKKTTKIEGLQLELVNATLNGKSLQGNSQKVVK